MEPTHRLEEQFHELSFYTTSLNDINFIHQHVVDAFGAQTADEHTPKIRITFALVGLYLYVEKNLTGKQVQMFHIKMSKRKIDWPGFILPAERGLVHISDVLAVPPGPQRDQMIRKWCESVWKAHKENRATVQKLVTQYTD